MKIFNTQLYSQSDVDSLEAHIKTKLIDFYNICVLSDMEGPAAINVLNGKKVTFTVAKYEIELCGNISEDSARFADLLAKHPERLPIDPVTFCAPYEQKVDYVALYTFHEEYHDDKVTGVLLAAVLKYDENTKTFTS